LSQDVQVKIGEIEFVFTKTNFGHDINFYPNGNVMSGFLKQPTLVYPNGHKILCQSIGFYDDRTISGIVPFEDTELHISGRSLVFQGGKGDYFNFIYTIRFNQNGELESAILVDGTSVKFL
jgi:hypothetical protein